VTERTTIDRLPAAPARIREAFAPLPFNDPTCDTLAGPDGVQLVDLGIYASWCTNLRTNKSWRMISG